MTNDEVQSSIDGTLLILSPIEGGKTWYLGFFVAALISLGDGGSVCVGVYLLFFERKTRAKQKTWVPVGGGGGGEALEVAVIEKFYLSTLLSFLARPSNQRLYWLGCLSLGIRLFPDN